MAFFLLLGAKMAVTAAFVVTAAFIAERAGSLIGAMVATLPVASGPAYILLALDHDAQFIADSAVASLAMHAATGAFGMSYVLAAQRWRFLPTIAAALAAWAVSALLIRSVTWSVPGALALTTATYAVCVVMARPFLHERIPLIAPRWFDVPLRALLVATTVGTVLMLGANAGPKLTGMFAIFPIVLLSLMLILHPRIGGKATACIIANTMWGLVGFGLATLALQLTAVRFGPPLALATALAVSVVANVAILLVRRRGAAARVAVPRTAVK